MGNIPQTTQQEMRRQGYLSTISCQSQVEGGSRRHYLPTLSACPWMSRMDSSHQGKLPGKITGTWIWSLRSTFRATVSAGRLRVRHHQCLPLQDPKMCCPMGQTHFQGPLSWVHPPEDEAGCQCTPYRNKRKTRWQLFAEGMPEAINAGRPLHRNMPLCVARR